MKSDPEFWGASAIDGESAWQSRLYRGAVVKSAITITQRSTLYNREEIAALCWMGRSSLYRLLRGGEISEHESMAMLAFLWNVRLERGIH